MANQREFGAYGKFYVSRVDGRDRTGGDREGAQYFVLDLTFDPFARQALVTYIAACAAEYPLLAQDLQKQLEGLEAHSSE